MKPKSQVVKIVSLLLFPFHQILFAQTSVPNTLTALHIATKVQVDGVLDEPGWSQARKVSNFTQRELEEGQPATEKTEVAVLYDKNNLYIGLWAYDLDSEKIVAQEMKHDFSWGSEDHFKVILSPFNDKRNGYLFVVNPNGAYADVLIMDEGSGYNMDWNGVWNVSTRVTEDGWFAEIEIPFSTLKFPNTKNQVWGFNMERYISRKNEQVLWQGWSRDYSVTKISQAGQLVGLTDIAGKKLLEVKPFISGGVEKGLEEPLKSKAKIGGDINYILSPSMKLNLTLNTDFSQVESDRIQINLTRFSILYPEKREFFLEGKSMFEFNMGSNAQTFYSRRIGIHEREEVPIIGGARLVGKAKKTNIGVLSIQTTEKDTLPVTNFSVIRLKQDILNQSNIGFIFTAKNNARHYNYVYGLDANYVTSKIFGNKNLKVGGALTQSFTKGLENRNNLGYRAYVSYPNDFIEASLSMTTIQGGLNPEIGYLRRQNFTRYQSELAFNPRPRFIPWIRQMEMKPFEISYYITDDTRKMESVFIEFVPVAFETKSGDQFEFNIFRVFDRLDEPFEIMDDIFIQQSEYWYTHYELQFETYEGRSLSLEAGFDWGDFYTGTRKELQLSLDWNLSKNFKMSTDWERNTVALAHDKFVADEVGGRFEYEFSSKLYSSLFGQWNNEDDEIILNYRINWIPKAGSYFYFVVNQRLSTESRSIKIENTTILAKLIWLF